MSKYVLERLCTADKETTAANSLIMLVLSSLVNTVNYHVRITEHQLLLHRRLYEWANVIRPVGRRTASLYGRPAV